MARKSPQHPNSMLLPFQGAIMRMGFTQGVALGYALLGFQPVSRQPTASRPAGFAHAGYMAISFTVRFPPNQRQSRPAGFAARRLQTRPDKTAGGLTNHNIRVRRAGGEFLGIIKHRLWLYVHQTRPATDVSGLRSGRAGLRSDGAGLSRGGMYTPERRNVHFPVAQVADNQ